MSYALRLGARAEQQLSLQPEPLQSFIREALERFAAGPSSVRSRSKSVTRGQIAEFRFDREPGVIIWVSVEFLFGTDEQTLHIEQILVEYGA
jgi:hypothetical protein